MPISFRTVRYLGLGILLAIIFIIAIFSYVVTSKTLNSLKTFLEVDAIKHSYYMEIVELVTVNRQHFYDYIINRKKGDISLSILSIDETLKRLEIIKGGRLYPDEIRIVKELSLRIQDLKGAILNYAKEIENTYQGVASSLQKLEQVTLESAEDALQLAQAASQYIEEHITSSHNQILKTTIFSQKVLVLCLILGISFTFFISFFLNQALSYPIHQLAIGMKEVSKGNLDYTINMTTVTNHEFGPITKAFNQMSQNLKHSQQEVLRLKDMLTEVTEGIDEGLMLIDTNFKILWTNKKIMTLSGLKESDILGNFCYKVTHKRESPCQAPNDICPVLDVLNTGKPVTEVHTHYDKDGNEFYAEVAAYPIRDERGQIKQFVHVARDITERKKTERRLFRLNRALRTLSEGNQVLVRATEQSELLQAMSRILVEVGGYRLAWIGFAEQDENKTVRPVAQAGYEEGYLETLNISWADTERGCGPTGTAIRTGKPSICRDILTEQKFAPWRDEALKRGYVSSIALPLIFETQVLGALNIYAAEADAFDEEETKLLSELAFDLVYGLVALRRHAEQIQQEELLKRLSSAVEQTADMVLITNRDGIIEYANPAFEKVSGYTKEETVGKTPRLLKSGEQSWDFYEKMWKTVLSGEVFHGTLINKKKNGDLYYSEKTIAPIKHKNGDITYFVSTDRDITERKEMEKEQRLAQLGRLVSDMAHEVNNPLMIISGNAQLCLMEQIQSDAVKNNLKIIVEECLRAKDIIQRLLKFSRPSKGQIKEININSSIESVISILEHQFNLNNIEIKRNYTESLPLISADEQQISEVIMNLLNNAGDAMPKGGVIEITTSCEKDFVRVNFQDTGCGMSEETKKKLFEPFFTTKEKGTGLGLSVCYGLIKAHNGELKFESELGKGTTATVLLPLGGVKRNA